MSENPVTISPGGRAYFTEGVLAYADAMRDVSQRFPDDLDIAAGKPVEELLKRVPKL